MDPGVLGAWIGAGSTATLAAVGGTIRLAAKRVANLKAAHQADIARRDAEHDQKVKELAKKTDDLNRKIEQLELAADRQDDVIVELRSQRDRLMVTAEIQDKFFNQLPSKRRTSGD
jgi:hypothetical protein